MSKTAELRIEGTERIKYDGKEYSFKELVNLHLMKFEKVNHCIYRNVTRKIKRQYFRQKNGLLRDQLVEKFEALKHNDPNYKAMLQEEETRKQQEIEDERARSEKENQVWLERERLAQMVFQAKKEKLEKERNEREVILKEKDMQESAKEKTKTQKIESDSHHNPDVKLVQAREPEECFYFKKTGACKFGIRCDRAHSICEKSSILALENMYSGLQQLYGSLKEDHECDTSLEYEDREIYSHFKEFYTDVLAEFKNIGRVVQFKVCCNYQIHLRGNVYVQFKREDDALKAFNAFNGRFYAGKQINCSFVKIPSWKEAICGKFLYKRCLKGRNCSYLHVFKDPDNEFRNANNDRIVIEESRQVECKPKIVSYRANEWSSPEIDERKVELKSKKRKRHSRSSSRDSSRHRHKKHKQKKGKKSKD